MPAPVWTALLNWSFDKAISVPRLNAFVGDDGVNPGNLEYLLRGRQKRVLAKDNNGDYTTTSTTWVDINATDFTAGLTVPAGTHILAVFGGVLVQSGASQRIFLDLTLDGTRKGSAGADGLWQKEFGSGNNDTPFCIFAVWEALSSGLHTVRAQWKVQGSTASLLSGSGTANRDNIPMWFVTEIG